MPRLDTDALLSHHRLLLVGGKGGVGKTTLAATLALRAADAGREVLLVSTDPAHSLADALDQPVGNRETRVAPGLTALEIDPEDEADAYLARVIGQMRPFVRPEQLRELTRQLQLSRQSPGAQEAALLERLARLLDDTDTRYDLIVLDTAPTGHTLRLLSLPEIMAVWTDGLLRHNERASELGQVLKHLTPGRDLDSPLGKPEDHATAGMAARSRDLTATLRTRQQLFHRLRHRLLDPQQTGFLFVLTPERLPILETHRALESLTASEVPVVGLLINRVLPADTDSRFLQARLTRQQRHLDDIRERMGQLPQRQLALQEDDIQGIDSLRRLGALLENR
ncbi:ArsA family ATPase [Isoalcanivorax indicus]|uniref:ArsA family ATPase n=1 Tax=Isoalcanivorax indicus TaxID=2202653 RepID=UPI000DBA5DF9|nr:ArsA family ATPase [Isoalcanivorax indicus]